MIMKEEGHFNETKLKKILKKNLQQAQIYFSVQWSTYIYSFVFTSKLLMGI